MARYLLVDDRDGSVLAELASARQAARVLARHARKPQGDPQVSVVRLDHHRGSLTGTTSIVSMRLIPPLTERRARINSS